MYGKSNMETYIAATAKSLQSCPTLCDPIDGSPPGSPVPGILQASTLEWVETYITICKIVLVFFFFNATGNVMYTYGFKVCKYKACNENPLEQPHPR